MFKISVKKAGADYQIDPTQFSPAVRAYVEEYGWRQVLSDSAASVSLSANVEGRKVPLKGKDLAKAVIDAKALVDAKLADLSAGVIRKTRSASGDPVENRARTIAIKTVTKSADYRAWVASAGVKFTDETATEELAKRAAALVESDPRIRKVAARQIEDEAMLREDDDESEAQAA